MNGTNRSAWIGKHSLSPVNVLCGQHGRVGLCRADFPRRLVIEAALDVTFSFDDLLLFQRGNATFTLGPQPFISTVSQVSSNHSPCRTPRKRNMFELVDLRASFHDPRRAQPRFDHLYRQLLPVPWAYNLLSHRASNTRYLSKDSASIFFDSPLSHSNSLRRHTSLTSNCPIPCPAVHHDDILTFRLLTAEPSGATTPR